MKRAMSKRHSNRGIIIGEFHVAYGYDDWYLPSLSELRQLSNAAAIINKIVGTTNGLKLAGYWSSTEDIGNGAMYINIKSGTNVYVNKSNIYFVRAVRKF